MAKRRGTRPEPKREAKPSDLLSFEELHKIHKKLCSMEPPECRRSFMEKEFRGHVRSLMDEKGFEVFPTKKNTSSDQSDSRASSASA